MGGGGAGRAAAAGAAGAAAGAGWLRRWAGRGKAGSSDSSGSRGSSSSSSSNGTGAEQDPHLDVVGSELAAAAAQGLSDGFQLTWLQCWDWRGEPQASVANIGSKGGRGRAAVTQGLTTAPQPPHLHGGAPFNSSATPAADTLVPETDRLQN